MGHISNHFPRNSYSLIAVEPGHAAGRPQHDQQKHQLQFKPPSFLYLEGLRS